MKHEIKIAPAAARGRNPAQAAPGGGAEAAARQCTKYCARSYKATSKPTRGCPWGQCRGNRTAVRKTTLPIAAKQCTKNILKIKHKIKNPLATGQF